MPHHWTVHSLMPLALAILALVFLGLGAYALARRRPFVLNSRWILLSILVAFAPSVVMQVSVAPVARLRPSRGHLDLISLGAPVMMILVVAFLVVATRGYTVFSTTQGSFRDALIGALRSLNLPFDETLGSIRLPGETAEVQVAVQGWIGTGQLRLRGGNRRLLAQIAKAMNRQFDITRFQTNMTTAIFYLILGLLMGVMVLAMMEVA